jgi:hypothetical protein
MPPHNKELDVCVTPVLQLRTAWHTNAEETSWSLQLLVRTEKYDRPFDFCSVYINTLC